MERGNGALQPSRKSFISRFNKIQQIYRSLFARQTEIEEEMKGIKHDLNQEKTELTAESILADSVDTSKKRFKLSSLSEELKALRESSEKLDDKGGLAHLCKTDRELSQLGEEFARDLLEQAKQDEVKRLELESRYKKLITELLQLEEQRKEFLQKFEEHNRAANLLADYSSAKFNYVRFLKHYSFSNPDLHLHLGKIKNYL
jgi:chromosome segregation ATPase